MGLALFDNKNSGMLINTGIDALKDNKGGGYGDGPPPWEREIRLGKDNMLLRFVYLNDVQTSENSDIMVQFNEFRGIEHMKDGKKRFAEVPYIFEDCPLKDNEEYSKKISYRYASNILVLSLTMDGKEVEPNGEKAKVAWSKRPLEDRVKILAQGGDTQNDLTLYYDKDQTVMPKNAKTEKGKKCYEARVYELRRFKGKQRVEYSLLRDDPEKLKVETVEGALEIRHDLFEYLRSKYNIGLSQLGYSIPKSSNDDDDDDDDKETDTTSEKESDDIDNVDDIDLELDDDGDDEALI